MQLHNVNTDEFLYGGEYDAILSFINDIKDKRLHQLLIKYPGYVINHRYKQTDNDPAAYIRNNNIPYFDILCETLLHHNDSGYIDLNEYTYQLNCFTKTIFHRIKWMQWSEYAADPFVIFVYNSLKENQSDGKFNALENVANQILQKSKCLLQYHRDFVYNDDYVFATTEDIKQLFNALLHANLFISGNDELYQIYHNVSLSQADTDMKTRYYTSLSHIDKLRIHTRFTNKTYPLLQSLKCKFNVIPPGDNTMFEGKWLQHKIADQILFIPQFLLFYYETRS